MEPILVPDLLKRSTARGFTAALACAAALLASVAVAAPNTAARTMPPAPAYEPADSLEGNYLAAYIAGVAGVPGVEPPIPPDAPPGAQVFLAQGCGSCHTMAAAGATGSVGPNLDEVIPNQNPADVEISILDPDAELSQGFGAGIMPDTYGDLPPPELQDLVDFLVSEAGEQP